jgi:hypothetical protein
MATAGSSHPALALADPPEAGWRVRTRSNEAATVDAELLAAPEHGRELATANDFSQTVNDNHNHNESEEI